VAIAFAREGADVASSYLEEQDDAEDTASWVSKAGRRPLLCPGDLAQESVCQDLVRKTVSEFGRLDILVAMPPFR
jgi:NAD(P)-dependent dehydrogenase (short-subunit alcohol dehydrogenase family)